MSPYSEQAGCGIEEEGYPRMGISVVIPSYRRGEILLDTIRHLLELSVCPDEILVVDQTEGHPPDVEARFQGLDLRYSESAFGTVQKKRPVGEWQKRTPDVPDLGKNSTGFSKDWKKSFQGLENIAFRRGAIVLDTVRHLLALPEPPAGGAPFKMCFQPDLKVG